MNEGNVDPAAELPELETLTIARLKELGRERGYNDIWRHGTKKADYIEWIRDQHKEACRAKEPHPLDLMMRDMKANMQYLNEQRETLRKKHEELLEKRDLTLVKVAELESLAEKTPAHYETIIACLKLIIKLNEGIAGCEKVVGKVNAL